ncbi:MAG: hypothetical protein KGJ96_07680 [Xanthomonadaceae bacterium]|jgi:uncharacterized protein YciI|nr:hypothetical protein [Xanthomonadaceae bacterium]MDE2248439.1 hypothetical protein [Xanthomonadaceae bacterium]
MNRYLVLAMRLAHADLAIVPRHVAYLDGLREQGRLEMSGPFTDKSGGAYLLRAADRQEAAALAHADPAHLSGGWDITVHEWAAK